MRPDPEGSNPDIGAFESPLGSPAFSPDITLSGRILNSEDGSALLGANIIAVEENNIHNAQTYSDSSGYFSLDVVSGLNYYVNVSLFNYQDQTQYLFINDSSNYIDIYLDIDQEVQDALVEGTLTDWYTNAPLSKRVHYLLIPMIMVSWRPLSPLQMRMVTSWFKFPVSRTMTYFYMQMDTG